MEYRVRRKKVYKEKCINSLPVTLMQLNNDCWDIIISYIACNGLDDVLKLAKTSKYFHGVVEGSSIFAKIGITLGLAPPKPKAKLYKTWKSLIFKEKGKYCERCLQHKKLKDLIQFDNLDSEMRAFLCLSCRVKMATVYKDDILEPFQHCLQTLVNGKWKETTLTKSCVVRDYSIPENLLETPGLVSCNVYKNPHGARSPPMRIYKLADILYLSYASLGSIHLIPGSLEYTRKIAEKKRQELILQKQREAKRAQRKELFRQEALEKGFLLGYYGADYVEALFINEKISLGTAMYELGYQNNIERQRRELEKKRKAEEEARRSELSRLLKERGLELRSDSALCNQYIQGDRSDVEHVVTTMAEMDWLGYEYTKRRIVDSEKGKKEALLKWIRKRAYEDITDPFAFPNPPPQSLLQSINSCRRVVAEEELEGYMLGLVHSKQPEPLEVDEELSNFRKTFVGVTLPENDSEYLELCHKFWTEATAAYQKHLIEGKCLCGNVPSPACGHCKRCCTWGGCRRHGNNPLQANQSGRYKKSRLLEKDQSCTSNVMKIYE